MVNLSRATVGLESHIVQERVLPAHSRIDSLRDQRFSTTRPNHELPPRQESEHEGDHRGEEHARDVYR
jgi:hypothetical protein